MTHCQPGGRTVAYDDLSYTQNASDRSVRLPLRVGMAEEDAVRVVGAVGGALN